MTSHYPRGGSPDLPTPDPEPHEDQPFSPLEDFRAYSQLITKLAKALNLSVVQPEPDDSEPIYITTEHLPPAQLTYVKSLLKLVKQFWSKPSAVAQIPRRMESLYKISGTDTDFLLGQPLPNSVVVKSTQFKTRINVDSAPMNKEGKKLDYWETSILTLLFLPESG